MSDLSGQRVLVLGLGMSGLSAARFCAERGARVTAADERPKSELHSLDLPADVACTFGGFPDPADFDLVVPSPGVPRERYAARARKVWGDIELAWRALPVPLIAVTGTNGKSTTTLLIEAMLRAAGLRARAAGNVGVPVLSLAGEALDVAVVEVSSFQLETIEGFAPRVAVVLNLSPDHLDRHGNFESYREAKAKILDHQGRDDVAVLNDEDPEVRSMADRARGRVFRFRRTGPPSAACDGAAWLDGGSVVLQRGDEGVRVSLDGLTLSGPHNQENVLAALLAVAALDVDPNKAAEALPLFSGLPHREQTVAVRRGVRWVDDSKATNPGAAARALEGCQAPVIWLAGGRDKGVDFTPLVEIVRARVRDAIVFGEAGPRLAEALGEVVNVLEVGNLESAVRAADRIASDGEVVLLSPACSSLDQFRDFAERGERFRSAVSNLDEGVTS